MFNSRCRASSLCGEQEKPGSIILGIKQVLKIALKHTYQNHHTDSNKITHCSPRRGLWTASVPTPWLKQGHQKQVARDHIHVAFEDLQGGKLQSSSGQPVLVLRHPHSSEVFPDVQSKPLHVSVCDYCLLSCQWPPLERDSLQLLCTLPSGIYIINKITPEPSLFSRLYHPSSLSPFS